MHLDKNKIDELKKAREAEFKTEPEDEINELQKASENMLEVINTMVKAGWNRQEAIMFMAYASRPDKN